MYECLNYLNRGGMGNMMFMGGFWILFLFIAMFFVWKAISGKEKERYSRETPIEVLQKEYAKGNISEKEYLEKKKNM